jgi:chloramphenicol 3-O-phosphotransferase
MSETRYTAEAGKLERAAGAEITLSTLNSRREKLAALYGEALEKTLVIADDLQAAAESLESAINRLVEVDASMVGYLVNLVNLVDVARPEN